MLAAVQSDWATASRPGSFLHGCLSAKVCGCTSCERANRRALCSDDGPRRYMAPHREYQIYILRIILAALAASSAVSNAM